MDSRPEAEQTNYDRPRLTVLTDAELEMVSGGRGSAQGIIGFRNTGRNSTARGGDPAARNQGLDPAAVTRFLPGS
jgi:hypothetical protein